MKKIQHQINGKQFDQANATFQAVFNPATAQQIAEVALADTNVVNAAVSAALVAFDSWSQVSPANRAKRMFALHSIVSQKQNELAKAISLEHGKTHEDALGEIARALEVIEYATSIPSQLTGRYNSNVGPDIDTYSDRHALGVVAGITPFNFPAMVPLWMIPMALACGNTFILKPSERNPSAANMLAQFIGEAGFPDGVFNVVHGDKEAVNALLDHPDIDAISFVGSSSIAQSIYQRGTASGKRVQALGGAKNHMVIMPDADVRQAADALMGAAFGSAGERCMAISVAVPVGEGTANRLVDELKSRIESLKLGPSIDPSSQMGPVITQQAQDRICALIAEGETQGCKLVVDGRGASVKGYENGYWVGATLLDEVRTDMSVYQTEIFGPVLSVVRADSFEQARKLVDDHEYGNGAAIFTRDGETARSFAKQVKAGMVGVNVPIPVPVAFHSFGGWKRSLFGSHGIYGPEGIHFYTKLKTVTTRWPSGIKEGANFSFPTNSE